MGALLCVLISFTAAFCTPGRLSWKCLNLMKNDSSQPFEWRWVRLSIGDIPTFLHKHHTQGVKPLCLGYRFASTQDIIYVCHCFIWRAGQQRWALYLASNGSLPGRISQVNPIQCFELCKWCHNWEIGWLDNWWSKGQGPQSFTYPPHLAFWGHIIWSRELWGRRSEHLQEAQWLREFFWSQRGAKLGFTGGHHVLAGNHIASRAWDSWRSLPLRLDSYVSRTRN